jgi:Flp pilus assembly protein TadD
MVLIVALLVAVPPPEASRAAAEAALESRDWARAEKLFREAVAQGPKDYLAWRDLGIALDQLGRSGEAAQAYATSLDIRETPPALHNLGYSLARSGKVDLARQMFERAIVLDPSYWRGWSALAKADDQLGDLPDALQEAQRAQQLRPDEPSVTSLVSSIRSKLTVAGVTEEALRPYRRGTAAAAARQDPLARDELQQAIAAAPRFADAHYNLAIVLRRSGDRAGAEKQYRAALASFGGVKSANRADAQNNLADLLLESGGRPQEAHALVTEGPRDPRPASQLSRYAGTCVRRDE